MNGHNFDAVRFETAARMDSRVDEASAERLARRQRGDGSPAWVSALVQRLVRLGSDWGVRVSHPLRHAPVAPRPS
jgi:hypothetical protein